MILLLMYVTKLYITSFVVDSLFTNIPLDGTIDICVLQLFGKKRKFKGFSKSEFKQLLQFAVKDSLFIFNGKYYIQCDGVAMGSPLCPMYFYVIGKKYGWKIVQFNFHLRYIDDTFALFSSSDHVKKFLSFWFELRSTSTLFHFSEGPRLALVYDDRKHFTGKKLVPSIRKLKEEGGSTTAKHFICHR